MQVQMAELFQTTKQNISLHIRNIFEEGELQENATIKDYLTVHPCKFFTSPVPFLPRPLGFFASL